MGDSLPSGTTAPRGLPPPETIRWPLVAARDLFDLMYGKALVGVDRRPGNVPVYGTNGACGSHCEALFKGPGVILGRKGQGPLGVEWCESDHWVIDTAYSLALLRPDIDLRYAYFLIKFIGLNHLKDGTSNPSLSRDTFGAQALPLPPLIEQRAIAHILGTLDDKIEMNRRMNETLEAMARALFKSWFVDFDPVHAKAEGRDPGLPKHIADLFPDRFEDSDLGEIPAGWEVGKIEKFLALSRDSINPGEFPDEIFEHFSIPAFDEGQTPKRELGGAIKSNKYLIPADAILLSKLNPRIPRLWLPVVRDNPRAICSTEFLVVLPRIEAFREFIYGLLASEAFTDVFETLVTGTSGSHQRVKPEGLLSMNAVIPDKSLIQHFSEVVQPLLARMDRAHEESQTLAALRDTLLPKLISGELHVRDAERFLETRV
jgi:type I restriction enzyme, S subunit